MNPARAPHISAHPESHPGTTVDPPLALPAQASWKQSSQSGQVVLLSGLPRPSPAPHPRRGGSARTAASGPFPAAMNQALWNSRRNQGSLAAVCLGKALSQISGEARRLGFLSVQQNLRSEALDSSLQVRKHSVCRARGSGPSG